MFACRKYDAGWGNGSIEIKLLHAECVHRQNVCVGFVTRGRRRSIVALIPVTVGCLNGALRHSLRAGTGRKVVYMAGYVENAPVGKTGGGGSVRVVDVNQVTFRAGRGILPGDLRTEVLSTDAHAVKAVGGGDLSDKLIAGNGKICHVGFGKGFGVATGLPPGRFVAPAPRRNNYLRVLLNPTHLTKAQKAAAIQQTLDALYPEVPVPLEHRDPYTLLVAVLLSAQCTDVRVNQVTPYLWEVADNPEAMREVPVERIREIIRPCGLSPAKSKAIKELSRIITEEYGGQVPATFAGLEALPGVGHKTASVVMSQAFGVPAFPVDTHIHRLAYRWALSTGKNVVQTERDLKRLFPRESWNKLHLQIIFFGREYCKARGHRMRECPICAVHGRKSLLNRE